MRSSPSGDEIDYLLMAQSVWREGDLDLRDNFARRDYLEYLGGLAKMPGGVRDEHGRYRPTHSGGYAVVLAPAYALGGRIGCIVLTALLTALLGLLVRDLALRATGDEPAALVAWAASVGPPVLYYNAFLYTEIAVALCIALALRQILARRPASAVLGALALSALPWLHVRMALAAVALGSFALLYLRGRSRWAFALTGAAMAAVYALYQRWAFGTLSPFVRYGGPMPGPMTNATPARTLVGLFVDGAYGLLPYAPAFLLGLAGTRDPRSPSARSDAGIGSAIDTRRGCRRPLGIAVHGDRSAAARAGLAQLVGFLATGPLHDPARPRARGRDRGAARSLPGPWARAMALGARGGRLRPRGLPVRGSRGDADGEWA